jgi:hypothetical protein
LHAVQRHVAGKTFPRTDDACLGEMKAVFPDPPDNIQISLYQKRKLDQQFPQQE